MEKMLNKKEVYFNEYNIRMENAVYLPIVSGQLQAYAQTISNIKENYKFMPFIFYRDNVNNIILKYKNPNVAAFSLSMWNSELSLKVAEEVKKKFPKCLIIFGGSNIPNYSNDYLEKYSFIDVVVRGEGERTFAELLEANLKGEGFEKILGITYRNGREIIRNNQEQILPKDLDIFPSPYVEGVFDEIMKEDMNFQAIIETNRGCPYKCAYCSWGQGGLSKKYRFFSSERNKQNAEWVGRNKIKYVFCADSNFGIFKEDINTTKFFINAKKKYGFPEIFRVCYSKNSEENVFEIGKLSHENQMEQSITLSFQTLSDDAAKSVGRENVSIEVFTNLQKKYNREGIPTYTELILGLPGETYESFLEGLEKCLNYGIGSFGTENQLYVYHCQIYPNAEMGNIEYQKKHGIKTVRCPLKELHAAPKAKDIPDEYEDVVISTNTLSRTDWERASVVAWIMHLLHGLKLGFYPMKYLAETSEFKYTDFFDYISRSSNVKDFPIINKEINSFWDFVNSILEGKSKCKLAPEFCLIYWNPEEISFLNIIDNKKKFYKEFNGVLVNYLQDRKISFDKEKLKEIIKYQELRIPSLQDYAGDKKEFARDVLLWRRKSGSFLKKIEKSDLVNSNYFENEK